MVQMDEQYAKLERKTAKIERKLRQFEVVDGELAAASTQSADGSSANRIKMGVDPSDLNKVSPIGTWEYMAPGTQCPMS